jgi:glycosyltransferase involved in cell wall biosynthesis
MMKMLSFIIPTLNEERYIGALLRRLSVQLGEGDEIIIVDSHSRDRTREIAARYRAKVMHQPRNGIGLAKTAGARAAKNNVVVFMDADCLPCRDFAERIRSHFSDPKVLAVGGLDLYKSDSDLRKALYDAYSRSCFHFARLTHAFTGKYWMAANNCAFRKSHFLRAGGFRSVVCEDTDLVRRLPPSLNVVYDSDLVLTLSDRRFEQHGFLRTVGFWGISNIAAMMGSGRSTDGYRTD